MQLCRDLPEMAMYQYITQVEPGKPSTGEVRLSIGPVYRSILAKDGLVEPLPDISTVWDMFCRSVQRNPDNKMLGCREVVDGKAGPYMWQTYKEVYDKVLVIGSAMRHLVVEPHSRCGVYSVNCPQWIIAMEACSAHSIICVPLYDTLGAEAVQFILQHAEVSIVFVQVSKIMALLSFVKRCERLVKTMVSFGDFPESSRETAKSVGAQPFSWAEFLQLGKLHPANMFPPQRKDICTIMFTSGTTGEPKGVRLTHENMVICIAGSDMVLML